MTLMELLGMERQQLQTRRELETLRLEARAAQVREWLLIGFHRLLVSIRLNGCFFHRALVVNRLAGSIDGQNQGQSHPGAALIHPTRRQPGFAMNPALQGQH